MGETISTLVFRPPAPTYLKPSRYFFLDIEPPEDSIVTGCGAAEHADLSACNGSSSEETTERHLHRIPAFYIKRKGAKITLLFSHGNAEDLGMMYSRIKELARILQVNIMAYDYTGYGFSTGSPSEEMCYRNIDAAYSYLRNVRNIPPSQIVLYGRSLGSGPSCYLAAKTARDGESVAAVILHSPFLSVYRVVMDCGFNMVGDMFLNKSNAADIRCPVLIVHGTKDEVVPFWHGQELLQTLPAQCRAKPFWADGLGHNNIEVYLKKQYVEHMTNFLNNYVAARNRQQVDAEPVKCTVQTPLSIPEEERAVQDPAVIAEGKFFVNQTWVRFGKQIINEAVTSRKKNLEARKTQHEIGQTIEPICETTKDATTNEKMQRVNAKASSMHGDDTAAESNVIPPRWAQHMMIPVEITTKTTDLVLPDEGEDNEEEREDENTNSMNLEGNKRESPDEANLAGGESKIVVHIHRVASSKKVARVTGMKRQKRSTKKQGKRSAATCPP